jgi:hypothetical protein
MAAGKLERAGGFVVGIVLFLVGFSLLQPSEGIVQTGITTALAAVLTALGIGVIAAAALPHSIEVNGQQFKPLGLDVKASGGAAVFLVTLGFIYYMKDVQGAVSPQPQPSETTATLEPGETPVPAASETVQLSAEVLPPPQQSPAPIPDNADFARFSQQVAPPQTANYFVAWTYCSSCCPQGPDYCQQVGIGEGANAEQAGSMAYEMCVGNGGVAQTCAANVQYISAADLQELGW